MGKKAMGKAMKTTKARKAMKAMKKISARTARLRVFRGKLGKTKGGNSKKDLVKNKSGKVVSRKRSAIGQKHPWIVAVKKARAAPKLKGFVACKKGTEYYKKAKEF